MLLYEQIHTTIRYGMLSYTNHSSTEPSSMNIATSEIHQDTTFCTRSTNVQVHPQTLTQKQ